MNKQCLVRGCHSEETKLVEHWHGNILIVSSLNTYQIIVSLASPTLSFFLRGGGRKA